MTLSAEVARGVVARHELAVALSHRVHANPELGFEEYLASGWVADELERAGMEVERGACGLPTSVIAEAGHGPLRLVVCAEYDALPGIGHACGHNLIAAIACLVGSAVSPLADDLGVTLTVMGTPAEETGGGKILMMRAGAFAGAHAVMMVHPASRDCWAPLMPASSPLHAVYRGRAAHAAAWPERGINAADAITVAQVAIGLLRQHVQASDRVHGYVSHGGVAANIVPDETSYEVTVRSKTIAELNELRPRVEACLHAGALATGCSVEIGEHAPVYADMKHDVALTEIFGRHAASVGHRQEPSAQERPAGSTDLGNVAQVIPALHPLMKLETGGIANHHPEFTRCCTTPSADALIGAAAEALSGTIVEVATDDRQRRRLLSIDGGGSKRSCSDHVT